MTATKVHLIKRPKTLTGGKRAHYWTLRWHDKRGRYRYQSIGRVGRVTRAEAMAAKDRLIVAIGTGKARQERPSRMTLSAFVAFHETQFGHRKRPTTLLEWRLAGKHAVDALSDKPLEEVTWSDAGEIRSHLQRLGRSGATIRKTLSTLRAMLNRAVKRNMIIENPFADEELGPSFKRPKRICSQAEIDQMIDAAPSLKWKALIQLAVTSGLRKSELLHLRWDEDVDLDACTVRVQGRPQAAPILAWEPKTARSTRTVPIPAATVEVLQRLKIMSELSPYLFVDSRRLFAIDARTKAGKLRATYELVNNFTRHFDEIQTSAKVCPRGCFHDLRKTFATRAASSGVPMHELQAHLGHSSITTTAEFYTEVEDSAADRLRKVFERVA